ncbi:hypothetical protein [Streptomyces sp. NPDC055992]|uniref:hypothetical protein n=1 Tax=Streptomyces sp. NPDC055992 TaxID=3345673 RepID=UPI0035D97E46
MSDTPPLDGVLRNARIRPSTLFLDGSFSQYVAFFVGMNMGTRVTGQVDPLDGFSGWLAGRLNRGFNLPWPTLVLMVLFPGRDPIMDHSSLSEADEREAADGLFLLLAEFLDVESERLQAH